MGVETGYIPSGNACFLKCINYLFKKKFNKEFFEFIQSHKRKTNFLTRYRLPNFCERYKINVGIYDAKSKRILPRSVKEKYMFRHSIKKLLCHLEEK